MKRYGLIGKKLSHSFSKQYFEDKFSKEEIAATYNNFELSNISEFARLKDLEVYGLNVTNPYKKEVIPLLDEIDNVASEIGAVNTIMRNNRYWVGYNTDHIGFRDSLLNTGMKFESDKVNSLILGAGGASLAVRYVLEQLTSSITIVSRSKGDIDYTELNENSLTDYDLIVNTTPVGMHPNVDEILPLNWQQFREGQLVYDLIYNPEKTLLLKYAEQQGASVKNGREMLEIQAEASWKIWNQL